MIFHLSSTGEALGGLAPRVGYHSAVVFSRAFARCVGLAPTQYRVRRKRK